jgi:hypothetical protein
VGLEAEAQGLGRADLDEGVKHPDQKAAYPPRRPAGAPRAWFIVVLAFLIDQLAGAPAAAK